MLHASAVVLDGAAVAFTAPSGTGKSTLAAHLVAAGASFLTDDVLALDDRNGVVEAHSGPARTSVSPAELRTMTPHDRALLGARAERPTARSCSSPWSPPELIPSHSSTG